MKRKLLFAIVALLCSVGSWAQPTASTPEVGNVYYLYNPTTKLFMTTNVELPFIRPTGTAWKLENGAQDGYITLRLKDNDTEGCGYFWGKWWANNPAQNSNDYAGEREFKLVNTSGANYKLQSYAWGATTAFIYINKGNEGDRSYRLACNSQDQVGLDEGYMTWQFISEEDYATYMSMDYTSRIQNNDFLDGTTNWTLEGSGNKQAHGNTAIEYWNAKAKDGSFDYYQNLSGLPAGKYVLRAAMYNSTNGETNASFDAAGQCGVYGTSNEVTKNANVTVDGTAYNIYTTEELLVPDGNLRLGFKNSTTMTARWFGVDWIQLTCTEYCLSAVATEFTTGNTTEADTWYYYNIPTTDEYEFTSSNAMTLTYSADGTQMFSEATGTDESFTAAQSKTIALTAGRLYFKTSAATTLTVSYKYSVGSATTDKAYIQPGQTVTVSYTVSTNDPGASLSQDYSGVTFNGSAISCTPNASGFTFTVPDVAEATAFTLAIPASAIGYAAGSTYNEAQNITLTTPALFDGNYYFRVASTYNGSSTGTSAAVGKYLSRGGSYGTHTTVDSYGQAITVTTDGNNVTTLKLMDSQAYIYHSGSWESWADAASTGDNTAHTIMLTDGIYRISSNQNAGKYFKYNNSTVNNELISVYDDGTGANNGPIINWAVETISEHATAMQAKKDSQAAAAAAAAYASGNYASLNGITTVSALETELTSNYIEGAFVSPSEITSVQESYQPRAGDGATEPVTVYSNAINITEPGFYKFSMQAFFRSSSNDKLQAIRATGADMPSAALFFGDSETQIKSVYDEPSDEKLTEATDWTNLQWNEKYYPNDVTTSLAAFKADKYHNDVWFYASAAGEYTYGVKVMGYAGSQWFIYSPESVTVTSYAAAADADDYTALQSAIDTYDAATWGFEKDQYAPYNNVEARSNIAAAKAIDKEATNSKLLVNSLTAKLALSANATDVDAIYNGLYATVATGQNYPDGWTRTNGWGQMKSGIEGAYATAYYNQPGSLQYGNQGVYTMPLKASQTYKLTFSYRSHEATSNTDMTVSVLKEEDGLAAVSFGANASNSEWKTASAYFTTGAAGNYVLTLANGGNTWMTNVSLVKVASTELELSENVTYAPELAYYEAVSLARTIKADTWNTFCVPFDISNEELVSKFGAEVAVAEFSDEGESADAVTVNFNTMATPAITANKPVLLKGDAGTSFDFSGKLIKTGEAKVTGTYVDFVGTYAASTAVASGNYFISANQLWKSEGATTIKGTRAYIDAQNAAEVKLFFDDLETGISSIDNGKLTMNNTEIYNLAGQKLSKLQRGVNIVNGKKVMVK